MPRKAIYIVAALFALVVIAAFAAPFLVDVNQFRPRLELLMGRALNRKVTLGRIHPSLLSGGVAVENLVILDDPAIHDGTFLKAQSVSLQVEIIPLIFSRDVRVTGLTIQQPEVTLLRTPSGKWNFSTLATSDSREGVARPAVPGSDAADSSNQNISVSIRRLDIKDGVVVVGDTAAGAERHRYDNVNLQASELSYTTRFPFELTAKAPGGGDVKVTGNAGPLNQTNMQRTPFQAEIQATNMDALACGWVKPASGIAGILDFRGTIASDGKLVTSKGESTIRNAQFVPGASPAREALRMDYEAEHQLESQNGFLKKGDVHIGNASATVTGTYGPAGETTSLQMKFGATKAPLRDMEAFLPAVGVTLPSGASFKEGTLDTVLTIDGPLDRLVISGPVRISNAKLTGFNLNSQLKAVATLAGLPDTAETVIETFGTSLRIANDGIRADSVNMVVARLGTMTGAGVVHPDQKVDFKMVARIPNTSTLLGALAGVLSRGQSATTGVPFRIQGTTSRPVFTPDLAGLAGGVGRAPDGAGSTTQPGKKDLEDTLRGIFGK